MQVAVRPNLAAAGAALACASVVAASSIAPLPDVHLPAIQAPAVVERVFDVSLAAATNPLEAYSKLLQDALAGVDTLISTAKPGQVLANVLANQGANVSQALAAAGAAGGAVAGAVTQVPAALVTAVGQLAAGNVAGATNTLLALPLDVALPLTDALPALLDLIAKPLQNVVNIVNAFTRDPLSTQLALAGFIAPLISTPAAAAVAVQNVLAAVATLNPVAVVNALLTAPATVADGLLNGGYGPNLAPIVGLDGLNIVAGGLLSPTGITLGDDGMINVNTGGPFAGLQAVLATIAGAIAPQAAAVQLAATDATSIPAASPLTLSAVPAETSAVAAPAEAPADAATDGSASAATESDSSATESATPEPANTEPAKTEAAKTEPAKTEPATSEPTETAPTKTDSTKADSTKTESTKAEPATTGKDVDVKAGNKVEPTKSAAADSAKTGSTSTAGADSAASGTQAGASEGSTAKDAA